MKSNLSKHGLNLLLLACSLPFFNVQAGGLSDGGGDVIICRSRSLIPLLATKGVYLADTFNFFRNDPSAVLDAIDEKVAMISAVNTLDSIQVGLGAEVQTVINKLEFEMVSSVEELDDDNIELNVPGCKKKQLAVQDVSQNLVRVNKSLFKKLSEAEKAFFKIHEAFINIRKAPVDTTPVRAVVRSILESSSFDQFLSLTVKKIDRIETARRTFVMISREMNLSPVRIDGKDRLSEIGVCDGSAVATQNFVFRDSIEMTYFKDVGVRISSNQLMEVCHSGTVFDLARMIWTLIPDTFKK